MAAQVDKELEQEERRAQAHEILDVAKAIQTGLYAALSLSGIGMSVAEEDFIKSLRPLAEQTQLRIEDAIVGAQEPQPVDERCVAGISTDQMKAWMLILPAAFGGKTLSNDEISQAVTAANIRFGIDEDVLAETIQRGKLYCIARGEAAVDGEDGSVIEHFEREKKATFAQNDVDKVDYKDLKMIQQVKAGEKICTIIQPTLGMNGTTVTGAAIKAKPGTPPFLPIGKNTELTEDQNAVIAKCDGQVLFVNQAFQVEALLNISGDVDSTIGNIDAIGTVNVNGNVLEGFTVKATGDINVRGIVEGATLIAGKNILVSTGVKGSATSSITAKGDIKCKYIENCTVHAGGSVSADMIINSNVMSNQFVEAKTGRSVIVGGTICARTYIAAKTIGNESNRRINLNIGIAPDYMEQHRTLEKQLQELRRRISENEKNIEYLEYKKECITQDYHALLNDLHLHLNLDKMQEKKLAKQLRKLEDDQNPEGSYIEASRLYPPANVNIGNLNRLINDTQNMCRIYMGESDIEIGVK